KRASFSGIFLSLDFLWSLYPSISGQASPSAFGLFGVALTSHDGGTLLWCTHFNITYHNITWLSRYSIYASAIHLPNYDGTHDADDVKGW
ncbi:MAG: hypothetical protein KJ774_10935, partial [Firmicutes bacterium]|nr:hypothetical protein [Bacillota bacterium]